MNFSQLMQAFNRLEAAVSHHKKAHLPEGRYFADDPDVALWKARDKILADIGPSMDANVGEGPS